MDLNLLCAETLSPDNGMALKDGTILEDSRVLDHLLQNEQLYMPECRYFIKNEQLSSSIRKSVIKWMQEVCDEEHCLGAVYPLAVNFFDRFLCKCNVPKKFLQLISADCILIASKIRQNSTVSVHSLCYYTNHSVTPCQLRVAYNFKVLCEFSEWCNIPFHLNLILRVALTFPDCISVTGWSGSRIQQSFELLIASKLDWDLSAITAYDFLDQILQRVTCYYNNNKQEKRIRDHSVTLIHLCYSENEFYDIKPSVIAASSIVSALRGLKIDVDEVLLKCICSLLKINEDVVERTVSEIERIISEEISRLNKPAMETKISEKLLHSCYEPSLKIISTSENDVNGKHASTRRM